jgi:transposase
MSQMTLMTGPERRRRWSQHDRQRILSAAFAPGAVVADVSRQYEVATSLIYKWRREALAEIGGGSAFAPAVLVDDPAPLTSRAEPAIVVELAGGARVSINAKASPGLVAATLRALR